MVLGDPVDAGDHALVGAAAAAVEHAHGDELDLLGDAVGGAAARAGHVRAVAVAVVRRAAVDRVEARGGAPAELVVRGHDAGVDDVGRHAGAGGTVGVGLIERQVALIDAVDAPRRVGL